MEATVILIKLTEQKFSVLFSYNLAVHLLLFWRIYFNWKVAALEFQWGSNPVLLTHISLVFERHSYKKKFTKLCAKYIEECQWNTQIVCVRKWKELIRGAFEPSGTLRGIAHLVISTTFGPGAGNASPGNTLSERSMALMAHIRRWVYYVIVTDQASKRIQSTNLS